ncbi:MAG: phospholipase D-like domain-containing protein, partial [Thermoplasmata archaeon]|nr:phospholipase D-like domain-containing protein [Thermoplasmata archaeon]
MLLLLTVFAPYHIVDEPCEASDLSSAALSHLMIGEFYPCGLCSDEYVSIRNPSGFAVDLKYWSLSDGEGNVGFTRTVWLAPQSSHFISWNATSFFSAYGRPPDSWISDDSCDGNLSVTGSFRLSDSGDSIVLRSPSGVSSDYVVYGAVATDTSCWVGAPLPSIRRGEVVRRAGHLSELADTDCSADWFSFREHRYGFTTLAPMTYDLGLGSVVSFTSPDSSLDVVLEAIRSARGVIRLCAYEFSSAAVCDALIRAIELGVAVRLLVDGAPAGGMDEDEVRCLSALAGAGAHVCVLNGNMTQDRVQHVGPLHAKYAVIDLSSILVLSENFVETGIPTDRLFGNRGWGLWIAGSGPASYLAALFDEDSRETRADVVDWRDDHRFNPWSTAPALAECEHPKGVMAPRSNLAGVRLTLFVSPDCSPEFNFLDPM